MQAAQQVLGQLDDVTGGRPEALSPDEALQNIRQMAGSTNAELRDSANAVLRQLDAERVDPAQITRHLQRRALQNVDEVTERALDRIIADLDDQRITPERAVERIRAMGPAAVLADDPALRSLGQVTASKTVQGRGIAEAAMMERAAGAPGRVGAVLDDAFGARNMREVREGLVRARAGEARALYDEALSRTNELRRTPALRILLGRDGRG